MTAAAIIQSARERGIVLSVDSGRIRFEGPRGALPPGLVAAIREHRAEVLALLEEEAGADQAVDLHDQPFEAEVTRRVKAFAEQALRPGEVPFLALPGAPDTPGGCMSCGATLPAPWPPRCPVCIEAARRVLAMLATLAREKPNDGPGTPQPARPACCPACGEGGLWRRVAGPEDAFCVKRGFVCGPTGPGPPPISMPHLQLHHGRTRCPRPGVDPRDTTATGDPRHVACGQLFPIRTRPVQTAGGPETRAFQVGGTP